jgi:peptidoglycan/LPS O-acetylase OafA/YrhL
MREEDLMRLLAGIGGAVTLIETIIGFNERNIDTSKVLSIVISIVLALIVILSVLRPDNPVPMNWLLYVGLGIVIIIFSSLAGGILILVAGFIGYTEK